MDDALEHDYDATKRRQYYLRTRNLKGRTKGSVRIAPPKKTRAQRQAERRKKQEAQIAALKSRLEKLRDVLAAETKKAQAKSGVDTAKDSSKTASPSSTTQKLTPAQKAKKAAAEKKARAKNQTLDEQVQSLTKKINAILVHLNNLHSNGSV
jgi:hypothetical protein